VISYFLFEAYKNDMTCDVIPMAGYPGTFRRGLIDDFAAKGDLLPGFQMIKIFASKITVSSVIIFFENFKSLKLGTK